MNRNLHSLPPTLNRTPFPTTCGGSIGIFHSVLTSCIAVGRWCTGSCNRRKPNEHNDVGPTGHGGRANGMGLDTGTNAERPSSPDPSGRSRSPTRDDASVVVSGNGVARAISPVVASFDIMPDPRPP